MNRPTEEQIPATPAAMTEALVLAEELLGDIELARVSLSTAALKASRLARLLNRFDTHQMFAYEAAGYPTAPDGVPMEAWRLAGLAGRTYKQKDVTSGETKIFAYLESLEKLEAQIEVGKLGLQVAQDRDVSVSSSNPMQNVWTPTGNVMERRSLRDQIERAAERVGSRRTLIYDFASRVYHELKYSELAQDAFSQIRAKVDNDIGKTVPSAVLRLSSAPEPLSHIGGISR